MTAYERVCDIIQTFMALPPGRVMLWNQKYPTPNDFDLFIVVRVLTGKVFGVSRQYVQDATLGFVEQISSNRMDTLSIDIMSRGTDARDRNFEVIEALCSTYAEQQMAQYGFYISKNPSAIAVIDGEDGSAIPYRFNVTVNLQYTSIKQKTVDYYDSVQVTNVVTNA